MKVVMPPFRMAGPMSVRAAAVRFSLLEAEHMMSAKGVIILSKVIDLREVA